MKKSIMNYCQGLGIGDVTETFGGSYQGSDGKGSCNLISFGNYCGRTQQENLEDAKSRLDNRVFFLGITAHGYQKPVREAVNPKHRDAFEGRPELQDFLPKPNQDVTDYGHLAEKFRSIDCYSGLVDGKHYGRYNRLHYQKIRHTRSPLGNETRFCVPICNSMNYGWWQRDLKELNQTKWYAPRERFPQVRGPITRFVDEMAIHDPGFMLF